MHTYHNHRAGRMALELAGENPTPFEVLLSERVASLWVLVEMQEALLAAWYYKADAASPAFVLQMARFQESSNRRYLGAIKTLARVQKLQGPSKARSTYPARGHLSEPRDAQGWHLPACGYGPNGLVSPVWERDRTQPRTE